MIVRSRRHRSRPCSNHHRSARRIGAAVVLAFALAALDFSGSSLRPAAAQDIASQKEQLERRKGQLDSEIAALDQTVIDAQTVVTQRETELRKGGATIELLGDEFARTVEARKKPARMRLLIALDAYERGDREVTNLLSELLSSAEEGRITELETQRAIYQAVVADADKQLAVVDEKLRQLGRQVTDRQNAVRGVQEQLNAAVARRDQAEETKRQLASERADVQRKIDSIAASATTALLTGLETFEDRNRPAIVVKIDNVEPARPAVGINKADVVFYELVEGGLTRLAAVFHRRGSDPVGPVRSARSTDVHLFPMLNRPLFANSGGNAGVRTRCRLDPCRCRQLGSARRVLPRRRPRRRRTTSSPVRPNSGTRLRQTQAEHRPRCSLSARPRRAAGVGATYPWRNHPLPHPHRLRLERHRLDPLAKRHAATSTPTACRSPRPM